MRPAQQSLAAIPFLVSDSPGVLAIGATGLIYTSYFLCNLGVFISRTKGWPHRKAWFNLGSWGTIINVVALLWGGLMIINFSLSYESAGLRSWFSLTAYVNFCLRLLLIFGLVFELPVAAAILARLGLVTGPFLARQRRYALLASAIVAAFHADLVTMGVIWIPLYLMYEVSIWVARLLGPRPAAPAAANA